MNLTNKFIYLFIICCQVFIACSNKGEHKLNINKLDTVENIAGEIIDSIYCDLNKDGRFDRISVIEQIDSSRLLLVEINEVNSYKIISSNKIIIGCKTCGYQSGDPFIDLRKKNNGFELDMEHVQYTFFYELDKIYLDEINFLRTIQTDNGIEEKHEIYSYKQFGKLNISDLKENFALPIISKKQISTLLNQTKNQFVDSTKIISLKEFQLVFTQFNKDFNMWYSPKLIVANDTLSIQDLPTENGSELSIRKSPNGKFFVLDNIIKDYVDDGSGNEILHENYACVIINVKEAKVEEYLQSECDGAWNDQNEWVSSGDVIFVSK